MELANADDGVLDPAIDAWREILLELRTDLATEWGLPQWRSAMQAAALADSKLALSLSAQSERSDSRQAGIARLTRNIVSFYSGNSSAEKETVKRAGNNMESKSKCQLQQALVNACMESPFVATEIRRFAATSAADLRVTSSEQLLPGNKLSSKLADVAWLHSVGSGTETQGAGEVRISNTVRLLEVTAALLCSALALDLQLGKRQRLVDMCSLLSAEVSLQALCCRMLLVTAPVCSRLAGWKGDINSVAEFAIKKQLPSIQSAIAEVLKNNLATMPILNSDSPCSTAFTTHVVISIFLKYRRHELAITLLACLDKECKKRVHSKVSTHWVKSGTVGPDCFRLLKALERCLALPESSQLYKAAVTVLRQWTSYQSVEECKSVCNRELFAVSKQMHDLLNGIS